MRSKPLVVLVAAVCLLTSCSGGAKHVAKPTPTPSPTPSPTPTIAPTDPLSGSTTVSHASLVAIKVDNAPLARPYQVGLGKAAIVYEEIVEGGLTRFLTVFESDVAGNTEVGPIRSGRESDVDILRAFGSIPVGFSGAQPGVRAIFHNAEAHHWLRDASYDVVPGQYRLGARRKDARNFYSSAAKLAAVRPGSPPMDIGLRFGPAAVGVPTLHATAAFSPFTQVGLRYVPTRQRYVVSQSGTVTNEAAPASVIIQTVVVNGSRFRDIHGLTTPRTVSTGAGKVVVLTRGGRVEGTWRRTSYGATHFLDRLGKDILLPPGPIWVLLLPSTGRITYA